MYKRKYHNRRYKLGQTPLMYACQLNSNAKILGVPYSDRIFTGLFLHNYKTVVYLVEELKVDLYETDNAGLNCFHLSAVKDDIYVLKYLNSRDSGLRDIRDKQGNTALSLACKSHSKKSIKYLAKIGKKYKEETCVQGVQQCPKT